MLQCSALKLKHSIYLDYLVLGGTLDQRGILISIERFHCIYFFFADVVLLLIYFGRMQALKEPVYTQREAEMAAGMGSYVLQKPDTSFTDIDMTGRESKNLNEEIRTT